MVEGILVYRGMDRNHISQENIWLTDSKDYAEYFARQNYNKDGIVENYILPYEVIENLCNQDTFEEIMCEYDLWQEIPEDSSVWENGDDAEYDLMHDLCFPSQEHINVLKEEGFSGYVFEYTNNVHSIMLFNPRLLVKENNQHRNMKKIIRLTESELRNMVAKTVNRILKEDVLGNDWREAQEDSVMNNYEPFESQEERFKAEDEFRNNHDWGTAGDEEFDPSYYEDIDGAIGWNDYNYNPSDNDLYSGRA